jgi:hypothetical protein
LNEQVAICCGEIVEKERGVFGKAVANGEEPDGFLGGGFVLGEAQPTATSERVNGVRFVGSRIC